MLSQARRASRSAWTGPVPARDRRRVRRAQGAPVPRATTTSTSTSRSATTATPTIASWCAWKRCGSRARIIAAGARAAWPTTGPINVDDPRVILPPKDEVYTTIEGTIAALQAGDGGRRRSPPGEVYSYTEGGNGELGFYLVSDGSGTPYRVRCRPPCFRSTCRACRADDQRRHDRRHRPDLRLAQHDRRRVRPLAVSGEREPMPTFKLDGQDIPFEPGDTIIRAAAPRRASRSRTTAGTRACRVAANCRMCLVEVEAAEPAGDDARRPRVGRSRSRTTSPRSKPKLAAGLPDAGGRRAWRCSRETQRARREAQRARAGVPAPQPPGRLPDLRSGRRVQAAGLLARAPGHAASACDDEPVHKPKAVRFGPTIVYDAERCIMCTRCVRFCDEVAKDPVLDMRERGNLNEIVVSPGPRARPQLHAHDRARLPGRRAHHQGLPLQGARLVPAHARRACARAARPAATPTSTSTRATNKVYRYRPRDNEAVNKYWMCDDGMLTYHRVHEDRVAHRRRAQRRAQRRPRRTRRSSRGARALGGVHARQARGRAQRAALDRGQPAPR